MRGQDKGSVQAHASGSSNAPKKNRFYSLHCWGGKETCLDVVNDMLKVFFIDAYALLDPGATL